MCCLFPHISTWCLVLIWERMYHTVCCFCLCQFVGGWVTAVSWEQTLDTVTSLQTDLTLLSTGYVASGSVVIMSYVILPGSGEASGVDVTHKEVKGETLGRRPGESNTTWSAAKGRHLCKQTHSYPARGYSAGWVRTAEENSLLNQLTDIKGLLP